MSRSAMRKARFSLFSDKESASSSSMEGTLDQVLLRFIRHHILLSIPRLTCLYIKSKPNTV
jgi:hypothetical protein